MRERRDAGFTLIETLAALAATAAIVSTLALIAGQWLPHWRHGFERLQRDQMVSAALDRVAADLAAAEFVKSTPDATGLAFAGEARSATFVRTTLTPNAAPGLEFVRYAEIRDAQGLALTRASAPFRPSRAAPAFTSPTVLIRAPVRLRFAYAGAADRPWSDAWANEIALPRAVRITATDEGHGGAVLASTSMLVRATAGVSAASGAKSP